MLGRADNTGSEVLKERDLGYVSIYSGSLILPGYPQTAVRWAYHVAVVGHLSSGYIMDTAVLSCRRYRLVNGDLCTIRPNNFP